ncbi:MAG: type II toxin-antitoxin system RelB/DinJ family antitoxin [Candidatus Omnitrophica bacterium]|nr:type II toxin-antitoxin system RelB/DinJ family antitoxin [Candidatus Omnitrophota bacterium]
MSKSAMIRARTEASLKTEVEKIFRALGLSCTDAINIFYRQVKMRRGIPFDVKIPNKVTIEAMESAGKKERLMKAKDVDDMFDQIGI